MNTHSENNPRYDNSSSHEGDHEDGFQLPDPDLDNVTVLTDSLPNNPILPWHHYDSPWETNEEEEENQDSEKSEENENNTD